jgi:hypothetical protein
MHTQSNQPNETMAKSFHSDVVNRELVAILISRNLDQSKRTSSNLLGTLESKE